MQAYGDGGGGVSPLALRLARRFRPPMPPQRRAQLVPLPRPRLLGPPDEELPGAAPGPSPLDAFQNVQSGKTLADVNYMPTDLAGYDTGLHDLPGAAEMQHNDLREMLLNRLQGRVKPMPTQRAGIMRRFQPQPLRARPVGPRRPILPQRQPLRARPY